MFVARVVMTVFPARSTPCAVAIAARVGVIKVMYPLTAATGEIRCIITRVAYPLMVSGIGQIRNELERPARRARCIA